MRPSQPYSSWGRLPLRRMLMLLQLVVLLTAEFTSRGQLVTMAFVTTSPTLVPYSASRTAGTGRETGRLFHTARCHPDHNVDPNLNTVGDVGKEGQDNNRHHPHRRSFLQRGGAVMAAVAVATMGPTTFMPWSVFAADDAPPQSPAATAKAIINEAFDPIRYELLDPQGGVAYMQGRIDERDYPGLLDFTRTYDLELRKLRMGRAKKLLQDKVVKEKATEYANAVTFDLIGINRSSRKGQEDADSANKYLQELRDDVQKFLSLEKTIPVVEE